MGLAQGELAQRELAEQVRPVVLARERVLPVLPALEGLLPAAGLQRGTTTVVSGSSSLALAVVAGPSQAGSWCAAVGAPSLGLVAAAELGVVLERFPLVASPPPSEWPTVVAALVDAFDVVLAWPPSHVRPGAARRLTARARERGAALVVCGSAPACRAWPEADLRLAVTASRWRGLGDGHGRLSAREVEVVVGGRRAAGRERRARLWLPGPDGDVVVREEIAEEPPHRGKRAKCS